MGNQLVTGTPTAEGIRFTVSNAITSPIGTTGKGDLIGGGFVFVSGVDASATELVGSRWGAYWVEGPDQTTDDGDYFVYFSATPAGDSGPTSGPAAVELASGVLDFIGTGYSAIDLSSLGDTNFTDLTQHQHIQWDGTQWINAFEDEQYLQIRNETGSTLTKGQLVYVSGAHNEDISLVSLAKADSSTTMPSLGAVSENIANNANGLAVTFGKAKGLNTSAFNVGDTVYVSPTTAGGITNTRPTGASELVQNVGIVTKSHAITGAIKVTGVGRSNDVPNSATFTGSLNVSGAATFAGGATFNSTAPQSTVTPAVSNDLTTKTYVDTVDASIIANTNALSSSYTNHAASASVHFTEGSIDHGSIAGLSDNDHPQYRLSSTLITNADMATMGAATVKGSVGGGTPADLSMTQLQSISKVKLRTSFHSDGGASCQLGAHPSTEQFLKNLNINIQIADLSTYSQVRMFCRIYTNSGSSNSPRLIAKYKTSYSTTVGDYSDIGTSEVSTSLASYTLANSGWINLADNAKIDDCYITVTQIGGDSSATPRISSLFMEFR
jgi:hypothetical protein